MKVEVTKQAVTVTEQSVICEGDYCVNECIFHLPECFKGLSVTAVFNNIPVPVTDGKCIIPSLNKGNGVLGVYAYKKDSETDEVKLMYSPEPCVFWVSEGSYTEEVAAENLPEISRYEEYCNMLRAYCTEYLDKVSFGNEEELKKCEKLINKVTSLSESSTDDEYPTAKAVYQVISTFQKAVAEEFLKSEKTENKTETLSEESTNEQYPTAKAVYDYVENNTSQKFDPESEKPQSGVAVAQAVAFSDGTRFSNALKGKGSGTAVRFDDVSSETHYPVITVRNKNLFKMKEKEYSNGSYVRQKDDGSFSVYKVPGNIFGLNDFKYEVLLPAGDYCFSNGDVFSSAGAGAIYFIINYGNGTKYNKTTFTLTEPTLCTVQLYADSNTATQEVTIYPQLESGSQATEYVPYADLTSVTVKRYGKNLFKMKEKEYGNGSYVRQKEDGSFSVYKVQGNSFGLDDFKQEILLPAGDYCFSNGDVFSSAGAGAIYFIINYGNGAKYNKTTFTLTEPTLCTVQLYADSNTATDEVTVYPQLELSDTATAYEPYREVQEVNPDFEGNVSGISSLYPTTVLLSNTKGVSLNAEYNRDINKAFEELQQAIISLGGNV